MVADRLEVPVLAVTFTVIVLSLEPLVGLTVHQFWLLLTFHETLELILNELLPASKVKLMLVLSTSRLGSPSCLTVITCEMLPANTVIVAVRSVLPVFAVTFTVIVLSLDPLVGLTVHQL